MFIADEKRLDHRRLRHEREILIGLRARGAVAQDVDGDAAPFRLQVVDDVTPQRAVQQHAVHEQRHRASCPCST